MAVRLNTRLRRHLQVLINIIVGVVALLLVYAGLLYFLQDMIVFPGRATHGQRPAQLPADSEELALTTADGTRLYGVYLRATGSRDALLFFDGNGICVKYSLPALENLREHGLHVMMVDYPGFGGSDGAPSAASLLASADAALVDLQRRPEVERIFVAGRSIGSGPACHLAVEHELAGLMLFAAFTDMRSLARQAFHVGPGARLLRHQFDNRAALRQIDEPVLIYHNRDDDIVPVTMAAPLQEAAAGPATLVIGESGGHNGISFAPGTSAGDAITDFLASARPLQSASGVGGLETQRR